MKKISDVKFYQKSQDDISTIFEMVWGNILVGKIVVPSESDKQIEFVTYPGLTSYQARKIAGVVYNKFNYDICIQTARKKITLTGKDFEQTNKPVKAKKPIQKKTNSDTEIKWTGYYIGTKYIGKYHVCSDNTDDVELYLKKKIESADAIYAILKFLQKYSMIKLGVIKIMTDPVHIDKSMSQTKIASIVLQCLSGKKPAEKTVKPEEPKEEKKVQEKAKLDSNKPVIKSSTERDDSNIDPQFRMKLLTLMLGKNQTLDKAKIRAQEMANRQYTGVKLLDTDGKFICNIYPNITEQKYITQMKELVQKVIGD